MLWKNQRRLRNIIQEPSLQMRLMLWGVLSLIMVSIPFIFGISGFIANFEEFIVGGALNQHSIEGVWSLYGSTWKLIIYLWIIVSLICMALLLILSHRIGGPARLIKDQIARFNEGDFSHQLSVRKTDLLGDVTDELEKFRKKQAGFSLIEILVVIAVMGVMVLGVSQLLSSMTRMQGQVTRLVARDQILNQYASYLGIGTSVLNTVTNTAALDSHSSGAVALAPGSFDPDVGVQALNYFDANNTLLIPDTGLFLNANGARCTPTVPNPSGSCPPANAKYVVTSRWVPGAANSYTIEIRVRAVQGLNNLNARELFSRRVFNGTGVGDFFTVAGTNVINGLTPGSTYLLNVMGFSRVRGTLGGIPFYGLDVEDCGGPVLYRQFANAGNLFNINWPDGHTQVSASAIIQAPAGGCVRVLTDGTRAPIGGAPDEAPTQPASTAWYTTSVIKLQ